MVVETLEPALDALLDGLGLPPLERSRRATLRADLAALGFTQTPTPSATPLPRSIAAAWGAA